MNKRKLTIFQIFWRQPNDPSDSDSNTGPSISSLPRHHPGHGTSERV